VENAASITRFPLSAFLAVSEGYLINASLTFDEILALPKESREHHEKFNDVVAAVREIRRKTASVKSEW
jgi:hypothetical protein